MFLLIFVVQDLLLNMPEYKNNINSKLPFIGVSIFARMSALANQYKAINLSQGFPDFDIDDKLIERVRHYMKTGHNQYAPFQGVAELRKAIAEKVRITTGREYDWQDEVNITAGATQAINTAISCFVRDGDEVIIFEPAYDSYAPSVEMCNGKVRQVKLYSPAFSIDWSEVKNLINERTKMIIINTPHNPTGSLISADDLVELSDLTSGTDIIVLSDEVYEHLVFDGKLHSSACCFDGLFERSLIVGSFGKTFHATGWKMGFILGPANLMAEFRKLHQFVVFTCNTPIQYALADFLADSDNYALLNKFYQEKRDIFVNGIKNSGFKIIKSYGTYFQLLDYRSLSELREEEYAEVLVKEYKIASIPVSAFYHDNTNQHLLRFCFAKKEETLLKAIEILNNISR